MHIGDIIHLHLEREISSDAPPITKEQVEEAKMLISKGLVEQAINALLGYAKSLDINTFNEIIAMARQWEELQRDHRIGTLSTDDRFRLASKITFGLLSAADTLLAKTK